MKSLIAVMIILSVSCRVFGQISSQQQQALVNKATNFLALLDDKLRDKTQFSLKDDERLNWHFVPKARKGVSFHDLSKKQHDAALELLKASLSSQGYEKTTAIVELENVLREVEGRGSSDTYRDPLNYYISIFGTPSLDKLWGWRFEGHHISFNFLSNGNAIESSTPSFLGSNPAVVQRGEQKGKQVLKLETELGFALVNSLSAKQRNVALISADALPEILSYNKTKAEPLTPAGLKYNAMNSEQQKILLQLLEVYVKNYELGFSDKLMAKIKTAGMENLSFAWAGSLTSGAGHYYRIQGPMLLIEYDNTQNNANHVHTAVRDLTNDFGEDILREHYERDHKKRD